MKWEKTKAGPFQSSQISLKPRRLFTLETKDAPAKETSDWISLGFHVKLKNEDLMLVSDLVLVLTFQ